MTVAIVTSACAGSGGILEITDAWAPPTAPNAEVGALYLAIDNRSDADVSISEVSSDRCARTEIHTTDMDENGVMRMRPASPELLTLAPGESLEMGPGGIHVMCMGLEQPFARGERIPVTVLIATGDAASGEAVVEQRN